MAVAKMNQIRTTLDKSIAYILRIGRPDPPACASCDYSDDLSDASALAARMLEDLEACPGHREGGVLAHHLIQSFSPDDPVTPRMAHEIGVRLAEGFAPGHRYVIATHADRAHVHNHIIVCAAGPDGRKLRTRPGETVGRLRELSDRLCREYGLSVIPEREAPVRAPSLGELHASMRGESVKDRIRLAVERAAAGSGDFDGFVRLLRESGVGLKARGNRLTFTDLATGMRVRDARLGRGWDEWSIMTRIGRTVLKPIGFGEKLADGGDGTVMRVRLPGTGGRLMIAVPLTQVVRDGRTYRAYLPDRMRIPVMDRRGRYAGVLEGEELYRFFARPAIRIDAPARERDPLPFVPGKTDAQRRYFLAEARGLAELDGLARELNLASGVMAGGGDVDEAIRGTERAIGEARGRMHRFLAEHGADGRDVPEQNARELDRLERDLRALRRLRERAGGTTTNVEGARRGPRRNHEGSTR